MYAIATALKQFLTHPALLKPELLENACAVSSG